MRWQTGGLTAMGLTVSFHHALRMKRAQVIIVSEMDDRRI